MLQHLNALRLTALKISKASSLVISASSLANKKFQDIIVWDIQFEMGTNIFDTCSDLSLASSLTQKYLKWTQKEESSYYSSRVVRFSCSWERFTVTLLKRLPWYDTTSWTHTRPKDDNRVYFIEFKCFNQFSIHLTYFATQTVGLPLSQCVYFTIRYAWLMKL